MIETSRDSFSFSIEDENDIKNLLEEINSSYSAEITCSFENSNEIEIELFSPDEIIENRKKRKGIPNDIQ
jgi:subtilisin-like proprotein convertase family protein